MDIKQAKHPNAGYSAVAKKNGKFVAGDRPKESNTTGLRLYEDLGKAIDQTGQKRSRFLLDAAEFYLRYKYGDDVEIMGLLPQEQEKSAPTKP